MPMRNVPGRTAVTNQPFALAPFGRQDLAENCRFKGRGTVRTDTFEGQPGWL